MGEDNIRTSPTLRYCMNIYSNPSMEFSYPKLDSKNGNQNNKTFRNLIVEVVRTQYNFFSRQEEDEKRSKETSDVLSSCGRHMISEIITMKSHHPKLEI